MSYEIQTKRLEPVDENQKFDARQKVLAVVQKFKEKTQQYQATYRNAFEIMFVQTQKNEKRWAHWNDLTMDKIFACGNNPDPEDEEPIKNLTDDQKFEMIRGLLNAINDCRETQRYGFIKQDIWSEGWHAGYAKGFPALGAKLLAIDCDRGSRADRIGEWTDIAYLIEPGPALRIDEDFVEQAKALYGKYTQYKNQQVANVIVCGSVYPSWKIFRQGYAGYLEKAVRSFEYVDLQFLMRTLRDMLYAIIEVRGDAKRSRTQGYGQSAEQLRDNKRRKLKAKLRFDRLLDAGFFNPEVFNDLLEPDGSCPPAVLDLVALQYGYDDFKGFRENFDYEQFTPDDEDLEKVYDEGWLSGFVEGDGLRDAVSDGFKDYVERGVSSFSDFQACCDNALKWANEAGNEYLEDFTYREEDDDDD